MKTLTRIMLALTMILASADARAVDPTALWLLDATESWTPSFALKPTVKAGKEIVPGETLEDHRERRRRIVEGVLRAALAPETPAVFDGPKGRAYGALLVLGIWNEESHFDLRVDKHHCLGLPAGSCDGGHAWCLGQVHPKDVPQLGYSGEDLAADYYKCARATLVRLAAAKAGTPKDAVAADRFCGYAIGHFETPCPPMRLRYQNMSRWAKVHPAP